MKEVESSFYSKSKKFKMIREKTATHLCAFESDAVLCHTIFLAHNNKIYCIQGVGGKMGSEWILGRLGWGVWIGFDCLRTGTGGGLL
jgi:hypothetical protein